MMYLGIDISKAKLDCTLLDPATDKRKTKAVVNPAQVRDFARGLAMRTKTDGTDSVALARYGALIQPDPWEAPPPEIRELKALITRLKRPCLAKNGDARTRAVLYMAAIVAAQYNPHVKALYTRLCAKGKTKMAALGAAMRKLVHLCFGVLKHQTVYQPNWLPRS